MSVCNYECYSSSKVGFTVLYWLIIQDWKLEKKSSDIFMPNNSGDSSGGNGSASDTNVDEEAPLIPSARLSYIGRTQLGNHAA